MRMDLLVSSDLKRTQCECQWSKFKAEMPSLRLKGLVVLEVRRFCRSSVEVSGIHENVSPEIEKSEKCKRVKFGSLRVGKTK